MFCLENFLGVVALQTPIWKNHCMREMGPFPKYYSPSGENSGDSV